MKVLSILFACCVLAVSAQLSREQVADNELKKWNEKRWGKKSWKWSRKSVSKVVTTTFIHIDDLEWSGSSNSRESTCSNMCNELKDKINPSEWTWVKSTWDMLKKDSDFATKIFFRYFKAFPESLSWFQTTTFVNVSLSTDASTNEEFLFHAYSCNNWWNMIWYSIENIEWINTCPDEWPMMTEYNKKWITASDWKKFTNVWMKTVEEELGYYWTPEVKISWEKLIGAFGTCFELTKTNK